MLYLYILKQWLEGDFLQYIKAGVGGECAKTDWKNSEEINAAPLPERRKHKLKCIEVVTFCFNSTCIININNII